MHSSYARALKKHLNWVCRISGISINICSQFKLEISSSCRGWLRWSVWEWAIVPCKLSTFLVHLGRNPSSGDYWRRLLQLIWCTFYTLSFLSGFLSPSSGLCFLNPEVNLKEIAIIHSKLSSTAFSLTHSASVPYFPGDVMSTSCTDIGCYVYWCETQIPFRS